MSSATNVAPPIPTLQSSTAVTPTDHGQIIVLVAWLCFTAGVLLSLVRVYIRWPLNALAGKDDAAYAVSALCAIVQTAITINAVSKGLGRTEAELEEVQMIDAAKVSHLHCQRSNLHNLPTPFVNLIPGYLCNRTPLPPLHLDQQDLRVLPLRPPRARIQQITPGLGSQRADIDVRTHIVHQRRHTSRYCETLAIS
jgi:hypothetical protein